MAHRVGQVYEVAAVLDDDYHDHVSACTNHFYFGNVPLTCQPSVVLFESLRWLRSFGARRNHPASSRQRK